MCVRGPVGRGGLGGRSEIRRRRCDGVQPGGVAVLAALWRFCMEGRGGNTAGRVRRELHQP